MKLKMNMLKNKIFSFIRTKIIICEKNLKKEMIKNLQEESNNYITLAQKIVLEYEKEKKIIQAIQTQIQQ